MKQLNRLNPLGSPLLFLIAVLAAVPVLLFSTYLPDWAAYLALGWLALVFGLRGLANGRFPLLNQTPADLPLLMLLLWLPVSLWATPDLAASLPRAYAFIACVALFAGVAAQRGSRWLSLAPWLVLGAGLALSAITLLGTNFSQKLPFVNIALIDLVPAVWRPFWNPAGMNANLSGGLLALFWAPAFVLAWRGPGWWLRLAGVGVTAVVTVGVLLAQSRGALLGVGVALVAVLVIHNWRWLFFWLPALAAGLLALRRFVPDFSLETLFGSDASLGVTSLSGRLEIWSRAVYMIQDFAFTGVGLGMVEPVIDILYPLFAIAPDSIFQHTHNIFLQVAAEMGLPALVATLAFLLALLALAARRLRSSGRDSSYSLTLGLTGALIAYLVHGQFEVITYAPRAAIIVWGLFGLLAAVALPPAAAAPSTQPGLPE